MADYTENKNPEGLDTLSSLAGTDLLLVWDDSDNKLKSITWTAFQAILPAGSGDAYWTDLSGTFATAATFTFSGTAVEAEEIHRSVFTCLDSVGTTRRYGYVKSASESGGTVTVTVVTTSDLASGDQAFKVTKNRKIDDYSLMVFVPGEVVADASFPQGVELNDIKRARKFLPADSNLRVAGTACTWQWKKNRSTDMYTSAQAMGAATEYNERRANVVDIADGDNLSFYITVATGTPEDLTGIAYIPPVDLFDAAV